jgi:two-component sensor histidine kinase
VTNAIKYGSLSNETGTVQISWELEGASTEEGFQLSWLEQGGPAVVAPLKAGFGSRPDGKAS